MVTNDNWTDIFSKDIPIVHPVDDYAPSHKDSSVARIAKPTCAQHCSGRHEIDGKLECPNCKGIGYLVTLHEYPHQEGHYFTSLEPVNGSPKWDSIKTPHCRDCHIEYERV